MKWSSGTRGVGLLALLAAGTAGAAVDPAVGPLTEKGAAVRAAAIAEKSDVAGADEEKALAENARAFSAETIAATQMLHKRLTGVPARPSSTQFRRMLALVDAGDLVGAARLATKTRPFYDVRVKNFAASFSNKDLSPVEPYNDLMALITGVVRDGLDARLLLTGNLRYEGRMGGLPQVSRADGEHYLAFERQNLDPRTDLVRVDDQWPDMEIAAGALTTRAWGKAFYNAGTNRRAVQYTIQQFLCKPIDYWKSRGLPADFIRRDVDRAPGGDPATFQNHCRNCHAPMDGMGGAFARLDFVDGKIVESAPGTVAAKYNINANVYPEGYRTEDDTWTNFLTRVPLVEFGWRGETEGTGVTAFGKMIAETEAFGSCMAQRIATEVCGRDLSPSDTPMLRDLGHQFEQDGYDLQELFARVAAHPACSEDYRRVDP